MVNFWKSCKFFPSCRCVVLRCVGAAIAEGAAKEKKNNLQLENVNPGLECQSGFQGPNSIEKISERKTDRKSVRNAAAATAVQRGCLNGISIGFSFGFSIGFSFGYFFY